MRAQLILFLRDMFQRQFDEEDHLFAAKRA
jgi:hypothetical protein